MRFSKDYLEMALAKMDFQELTEVQQKVIPLVLAGKDLIVEANTGSGKTHAYLLPIFELLYENDHSLQALICAPTRELAKQILNFARFIVSAANKDIDVRLYVGGTNKQAELNRLETSQPQIAIGTPGKLRDLIRQENRLKSHTARIFVVDEADMTLDEGFLNDVDMVAATLSKEVQMLVFSATIPEQIQPFLRRYLQNPENVFVDTLADHNLSISHYFIKTKEQERSLRLQELLEALNPYLAIVFCNTKTSAEAVYRQMLDLDLNVALVTGDVPFRKRKQLIERIKNLDFQYVVATDILSRGIDIEGISHIINYELPEDFTFYVHRTGRTGRMGSDGMALSLYEFADNSYLEKLQALGIKCLFKEIKDSQLVEGRRRKEQDSRRLFTPLHAPTAIKSVGKPKQVKPGYKAKYKREVAKQNKKLFRKSRNK